MTEQLDLIDTLLREGLEREALRVKVLAALLPFIKACEESYFAGIPMCSDAEYDTLDAIRQRLTGDRP